MSEIDKVYTRTNLLPNRDFFAKSMLNIMHSHKLNAFISYINNKIGGNVTVDEETNLIAYGKDAQYLGKNFQKLLDDFNAL